MKTHRTYRVTSTSDNIYSLGFRYIMIRVIVAASAAIWLMFFFVLWLIEYHASLPH